MSKSQKKLFKSIKRPDQQEAFVQMLICQQEEMGRYTHWGPAYLKKLKRKKAKVKFTLAA
jgi:hypothetical protein